MERFTLVPRFVTVTVALVMTPPELSTTVPMMSALVTCATAVVAQSTSAINVIVKSEIRHLTHINQPPYSGPLQSRNPVLVNNTPGCTTCRYNCPIEYTPAPGLLYRVF